MVKYYSEADVETKYVYNILLKDILDIPDDQITFHVPVKFNQGLEVKNKEADVLVKDKDGYNFFVIDSKAPNQNLESFFGQIDSYSFSLETPLSILTNGNRLIVRVYQEGNKRTVLLDKSIEQLDEEKYESLISILSNSQIAKEKELVSTEDREDVSVPKVINYRRTFRNIHNKIRSMDKLDPSASFDEFSKVLFIKIINDELNDDDDEKLTINRIESMGSVKFQKSYIDKWFQEKVQDYYPGIFAPNETVALSPAALIEILNILEEDFDLRDSLTDVKGRAFEEFLPSQLRGKGLGQFFTPRPVVDFMVSLADISFDDKVLDFASGSGGFLIKAFSQKKKLIEELPPVILDAIGKTKEDLEEAAKQQIFGIDAEPRAVRTAKMNMLLWGDGKQIQHGNGLATTDNDGNDYLISEYDENDSDSGVDVILANPPFGSSEKNQDILARYSIPNITTKDGVREYSATKTENLFVERAWKLLKPDGKLLIVLPEGIFSNTNSKTRDFILSHFRIDSIIKLPNHAFVMSGVDTINTVILVAYKNNETRQNEILTSDKDTWISEENPMTINFASVNQIGFEPSGKVLLNGFESSDFRILLDKLTASNFDDIIMDPIEYANLEFSDNDRSQAWRESAVKFTRVKFDKVPKRIDPTYFFFNKESENILDSFVPIPITKDDIFKDTLTLEELEESPEKIYNYISVVKNMSGTIEKTEDRLVSDIISLSQKPQKLQQNDIVFNPYRINTGSIIRINDSADNLITSNAYVVIRNSNINSEYLVQLLKTPFMKYQIQVLASGSVRDNFGSSDVLKLKIPDISSEEEIEMVNEINEKLQVISNYQNHIQEKDQEITDLLIDF